MILGLETNIMFNVTVYQFTYSFSLLSTKIGKSKRRFNSLNYLFCSLIRLAPCVIFIAQIVPLSFQAAIEHKPRQVR